MVTAEDRAQIEQVIATYGHVVDDNAGDRAHLVFAFSEFGRPNAGPPISGDYRDEFVRTPRGWRLRRRRSSVRDPQFL